MSASSSLPGTAGTGTPGMGAPASRAGIQVLAIAEADPRRDAIERRLATVALDDLLALHARTLAAARTARAADDMPRLFDLVRGLKTLQRIAGERGHVIMAPTVSRPR
ncbi:hypothetical protein P7L78_18040 [Tistrella bauzanensis]|uniref:Uncharacterized protein n=1 Tax=Tistrella arctica TaxID=3133430 RepID=A0ABU9YDG6_9PROT